jgi:ABC-type transport system substrate-binding protein
MNKLIAQQRQAQNPQTRQKIFTEIQELVATDVPVVPLVQTKDYAFAQKGVLVAALGLVVWFEFGRLLQLTTSKQHINAKPKNLNIDIHFLTDKRKSIMFRINYSIKYKQQLS